MNPDLQSYISQQRQTGVSDEVIKTDLKASGWNAADISNALGPTTTVTSLGLGLKIGIAILVGIVLIGGGVLIFKGMKNKNSNNVTIPTSTPIEVSKNEYVSIEDSPYACGKYITAKEVNAIMGKDYSLGLTSYGGNEVCTAGAADYSSSFSMGIVKGSNLIANEDDLVPLPNLPGAYKNKIGIYLYATKGYEISIVEQLGKKISDAKAVALFKALKLP